MEEFISLSIQNQQSEEECIKKIEDATKEWDAVQEIVPSFANEKKNDGRQDHSSRNAKDTSLVSITQVLQDFQNKDLTSQKKEVQVSENKCKNNFQFLILVYRICILNTMHYFK